MFFNKYDFMKLLKKRKMYTIDGFTIELSEDHNLPGFQKSFPMYDRFVPCLGELADAHSGGQKSAGGGRWALVLLLILVQIVEIPLRL